MKEDKRYLVAMIRRRLIALKVAVELEEEKTLMGEIGDLMVMLTAVIK